MMIIPGFQEKSWTIPTVLCRRKDEEVWLTGEEAYACTLVGEGVMVDKLVKMAAKGGTSTIGEVRYTGSGLLNLFIRKVLEYPKKEFGVENIGQLVVSLHRVDAGMMDLFPGDSQGASPCHQPYGKLCLLCAEPEKGTVEQPGRAV